MKACIIYVKSTQAEVTPTKQRLMEVGYAVCESLASIDEANAAQLGAADLPRKISECIANADLCIFLLPENESDDGCIGGAASMSSRLGKRMVGIVAGDRAVYGDYFDSSGSMLRVGSTRISSAIAGENVWEEVGGKIAPERKIKHLPCQ